MSLPAPPDQDVVVIGASGDLAARKLLPALYNLSRDSLLPERGRIVGAATTPWSDEEFRAHTRDAVATFSRTGLDAAAFDRFAARLAYVPVGRDDLSPLRERLRQARRLAYLAVPASAFEGLVAALGAAGVDDGTSVVIEKPFGRDAESARSLNAALHQVLPEERIFRIDHYLGKETVQNLLVFRFGNSLFERVWNRDAIERVEITVAESLGVEHRGAFYEETGALRDIVQNHLFQLLAVVAMEPPISFEAESVRNEKVKVLRALHPLDPALVVRGQYGAGTVEGEPVPGYRGEPGVAPHSATETFVALRAHIDAWRWSGVPFLLRTGKRMPARQTQVVVTFRDAPLHLFSGTGVRRLDENRLVVRVQPDEGIALTFAAKRPGPQLAIQAVGMDFSYGSSFRGSPPEAYERLIHDALTGDHTLFIREDEVERGWEVVQPVIESPPPVELYAAGTWGPAAAERLARPGGWLSAGAAARSTRG